MTETRFLPDPFDPVPGRRMYRTGDLARYRRDGQIQLIGRTDHQIKLRGHRIELGEIEAELASHEQVANNLVMLREDILDAVAAGCDAALLDLHGAMVAETTEVAAAKPAG